MNSGRTSSAARQAARQPDRTEVDSDDTRWLAREPGDQPPVRWREPLAALLLVVMCDLTIYRGRGFAGWSLLFLAAPLLLSVGAYRPRLGAAAWAVGAMLACLAAKTVWCGSALCVGTGCVCLAAFACALAGQTPHVAETALLASLTIATGYKRLAHYARRAAGLSPLRAAWLNLTLPLAALLLFGAVFVLANPDLLASVSEAAEALAKQVRSWLLQWSAAEMVFWVAAAWISTGLLRQASAGADVARLDQHERPSAEPGRPAPLYPAFRNTLVTVIVLFAAYLAFEFRTLWFREFPSGFYYSGYAHEGAAWLTFALALATVVLSLVFRGAVLGDPRVRRLRALGWIWSAENFILAAAVYHRMVIYIRFNGMSPMRIVGLFGMSAVVVGFSLVLWKIAHRLSFGWLVRRQLWTLALTAYLFALTPVDALVVKYNVARILAGDPAASVQISVHPIGSEGILFLRPLLTCDDAVIREGVRAMLAVRDDEAEAAARRRGSRGWTAYQLADSLVLRELRAHRARWATYHQRPRLRDNALARFHEYAYQWY
jgi:hypothetical protein